LGHCGHGQEHNGRRQPRWKEPRTAETEKKAALIDSELSHHLFPPSNSLIIIVSSPSTPSVRHNFEQKTPYAPKCIPVDGFVKKYSFFFDELAISVNTGIKMSSSTTPETEARTHLIGSQAGFVAFARRQKFYVHSWPGSV
jgi:hypothetical protein